MIVTNEYQIAEVLKRVISNIDGAIYPGASEALKVVCGFWKVVVVVDSLGDKGERFPESLEVTLQGLSGTWQRCFLCDTYANLAERGMHFSIMGQIALGCYDCRPPERWTSFMNSQTVEMGLMEK